MRFAAFGAGFFRLACYLQAVLGCWLLSVTCEFLFVVAILTAVVIVVVAVAPQTIYSWGSKFSLKRRPLLSV